MEYLEERYPEPPLLPSDPGERAAMRLCLERFEELSGPYYGVAFEGKPVEGLEAALAKLGAALSAAPYLVGSRFGLADIAYVPWIIRVEGQTGIELGGYASLHGWLDRLAQRPSIAPELELVAAPAL
jgi:glutathione S-transferase